MLPAFSLLAQVSTAGLIMGLVFMFLVIIVLLAAGVMVWKEKKNKKFLVVVVVAFFALWALLTFSGMFE